MKIVSFNINSVRARLHQLEAVVSEMKPDVICLQETKVSDQDFPLADIHALGYQVAFYGQKGHYGVATLYKKDPVAIIKGYSSDEENAQRRAITTIFEVSGRKIAVFNGYFPQGENRVHETKFPAKRQFYADLKQFLNGLDCDDTIILGDFNISHQDIDIGIGEVNRKRWLKQGKCSFLPEEREWLNGLMELGYFDTFRRQFPKVDDCYSWFDYRSKGFDDEPKRGLRIDLILASDSLSSCCKNTGISYEIRAMEKPSDHCPIWAEFEF